MCFQYPCLISGISLGCSTGSQMMLLTWIPLGLVVWLVYCLLSLRVDTYDFHSLLLLSRYVRVPPAFSLSLFLPYVSSVSLSYIGYLSMGCSPMSTYILLCVYDSLCVCSIQPCLYRVCLVLAKFGLPSAYVCRLRLRTQITWDY
jgi:hypothetical protein